TPAERPGAASDPSQNAVPSQTGTLWAETGNFVRPMPIELGLTDGTWTEVQGEGLAEGTTVVTGTLSMEAADESASGADPFLPQIFHRRGPTNAIPTRRSNGS
ncbi:MAG TPA: hypothetical protein VMQ67_10160, partial [Candidatus Saccharimonadales bacterium]|nr:hypothetical protein [Candidatus Saccharimonadales bacterium]